MEASFSITIKNLVQWFIPMIHPQLSIFTTFIIKQAHEVVNLSIFTTTVSRFSPRIYKLHIILIISKRFVTPYTCEK